jgi:hypothetical protein
MFSFVTQVFEAIRDKSKSMRGVNETGWLLEAERIINQYNKKT